MLTRLSSATCWAPAPSAWSRTCCAPSGRTTSWTWSCSCPPLPPASSTATRQTAAGQLYLLYFKWVFGKKLVDNQYHVVALLEYLEHLCSFSEYFEILNYFIKGSFLELRKYYTSLEDFCLYKWYIYSCTITLLCEDLIFIELKFILNFKKFNLQVLLLVPNWLLGCPPLLLPLPAVCSKRWEYITKKCLCNAIVGTKSLFKSRETRGHLMYYRVPGVFVVVRCGSFPLPSPLSRQEARPATHRKTENERHIADRREGGGEGEGANSLRQTNK